jgi:hypothetical protein
MTTANRAQRLATAALQPPLCLHYRMDPASVIRSLSGRTYVLSIARKITPWRRLKHKLGWPDRDTLTFHSPTP